MLFCKKYNSANKVCLIIVNNMSAKDLKNKLYNNAETNPCVCIIFVILTFPQQRNFEGIT